MDCLILDTNIITQLIRREDSDLNSKLTYLILNNVKIFINSISYYEIKRGLLKIGAKRQLKKFEEFSKTFEVLLLDTLEIFEIASEIYAYLATKGKPLEDADILIASLALFKGCHLLTQDKDFSRIRNLKIIDLDSL